MNEKVILGMVEPYLKNRELTYEDFDKIFSMLSLLEQYAVLDILAKHGIELIDGEEKEILPSPSQEEDFKILYDDALFSDEDWYEDSPETEKNTEFLKVRKKITLPNEVLVKMVQDGDPQAKQDLCIKNQALVDKYVSAYQHFYGSKLEFEDLEQAGMLGMIKAAEKFDFNVGAQFSTYAIWWIKQAIIREIEDNGYTIRIPVHKMEQIHKVMRLDSKFAYISDYKKRIWCIADEACLPIDTVEDCIRLYHQFILRTSLDTPVGEEDDVTIGDMIAYEDQMSVEDTIIQQILRERIKAVLATLTQREQEILKLRFGLDDGRARTLEEVGMVYGVTRERIRQIEAKALRKLRHKSRSGQLKDFLS